MSINEQDVRHVAHLSRLAVTDQEVTQLTTELGAILAWIDALSECDTTGVAPTAQVTGITNASRSDVVESFERMSDLVEQSPHPMVDGMIALPNIMNSSKK